MKHPRTNATNPNLYHFPIIIGTYSKRQGRAAARPAYPAAQQRRPTHWSDGFRSLVVAAPGTGALRFMRWILLFILIRLKIILIGVTGASAPGAASRCSAAGGPDWHQD